MVRAVTEAEDGAGKSLPRSGIIRYEEGGRPRTAHCPGACSQLPFTQPETEHEWEDQVNWDELERETVD